ncbi:response regulator transcription factor [Marinobacterium stanieri]|uniref:response regulator transcription factor n=1 Tax=Marinobacterium stanieri TaxID=49186 RepID=UPI000255A5DF|nr:LuxR C-terminal-related transcriptional regulator [Marinobacterium stanieri]
MATHLAPRELEYVQYLQQDLSDKQIARIMGVAPGTVQGTARRVRYKLHAASRIQVLINATREGLISLCVLLCVSGAAVSTDLDMERRGRTQQRSRIQRIARTRGGRGLRELSLDYLENLTAYDLEAYA